jgi:carbon monoxide dehydrogenase subunit G
MRSAMAETVLAEKNFSVGAPPERVWRLIGKVIFSALPGLENIEILDENSFRGVLRLKLLGLQMSNRVKGEIVDVLPTESFSVNLILLGPGGLFTLTQRASFAMKEVDRNQTEITAKATADSVGFLFRLLLIGQARRFAQSTFEAIEKRLQDLA